MFNFIQVYSTFTDCHITTKKLYIDPDVDLDPKPNQRGHKEETLRREPFYRLQYTGVEKYKQLKTNSGTFDQ